MKYYKPEIDLSGKKPTERIGKGGEGGGARHGW